MEVTPVGNTQIQKEHSATSESKQMEVSKDLGHTKVMEQSSSFQSDERSMVVEESSTQSMEATRSVQQSFSSSVTAEKKVSKSTISSSSSFEASEGFGIPKLDPTQTYETNTSLDAYRTAVEVDPGPILPPEQQTQHQESTVTEQPKTFEPESKPEPVKAKTPPKSSPEIEEGKIKNTLKEIISEIDHYVEKNDDTLKESCVTRSEMKETTSSIIENNSGSDLSYENVAKFANMNVTSEEHKIAQELNQVLKTEETETKDENGPSKPIDLEKIFTPAHDDLIQPSKGRKMYSSSSFYSSSLHPTVEDQVELARRISSSLSDISNQKSKGQSMYVNRKKRSVKWVHEGEGKAPPNGTILEEHDENKPILKLIMDPRGQVQDLSTLRRQGYTIEPAALSPDVCLEIVKDLNSPKGKGAELFAKRRKKSEKWIVGENSSQTTTQMSDISSSTKYIPVAQPSPQLSKLPPLSYLEGSAQRVQHNQKLDEIQERFTRPRVKLVKSPWEAALETGSVDSAFQDLAAPSWPTASTVVAPAVDSYEAALRNDTLPSWTAPANQNGLPPPKLNPPPKSFSAPNPAYNSSSVNRLVDNFQKGLTNVDVYKPKVPQAWNAGTPQQVKQSSPYSTLPRPSPQPATTPAVAQPTPAPAPAPAAMPQEPYIPTPQASPRFMDYSNLNNYNTAARGWGQMQDYYRPVTFEPVKLPRNLVYTDF